MYLSKESIINLFFQMNFLYSGEDTLSFGDGLLAVPLASLWE